MASNDKLIRIILKLQDDMSGGLDKSASSLDKLKNSVNSLGSQMTAGITAPFLAIGAAGLKMSMDLDKAMKNIDSIANLDNVDELPALAQTFKDMSINMDMTTDSAENLAKAYYQIISSGVDSADALGVLETATKAATAGLTDTATAAEGIVSVLNSYGLEATEAARISDLMFETVNRGVGTFEQLTAAVSNVTGVANALGVPFEEVSAAIATMSKQGYTFATASNAIRQAMTSLIKPTADGEAIIKAMGYSSGEAMIEALGLAGAMQAVAEHTGGSVTEMSKLFSDVDGLKAALALTGDGAQMFAEDLEAMANSAGATQAAFAVQMESFAAVWANFQNTVGVALMEIGDILLPFLADLLQNYITPLVKWFIALDDSTQGWIIGIGLVVAAIGPLLLIVGQLVSAWGAIAAIMPAIGTAFAGFMALGAPMIALIGALIAALWLLATNWEQIGTTLSQTATLVDHAFGNVFSKARNTAGQIATLIGAAWSKMASQAWTALSQLGQIVAKVLGGLPQTMMKIGIEIMLGIIKGVSGKVQEFIGIVKEMAQNAANAVKNAFGIRSPSKLMQEYGQQVVAGFNKGIDSFGGIGVTTPEMGGASSSMPVVGAAAGGGGGNVYIQHLNVPAGTSQEQITYIMEEIGKAAKRKGAKGF